MPAIIPCLWFADNNCREAIEYYTSVFPNSKIHSIDYYPDESLDEHFVGMTDKVLHARFSLGDIELMALDGGDYFRFNEAISFTIECLDQAELDYYWQALSHQPEHEQCGWCKDRFGLSWQIVPKAMMELTQTPAQIQAMMQMKKIIIQDLLDLA